MAQVQFTMPADGQLGVEIGGKPFTTFLFGPDTTKPYLAPIHAASGTVITRHYPMQMVEGESRDHPHHRGLWFGHGDVTDRHPGITTNTNKGRIVLDGKITDRVLDKKRGIVEAKFKWIDAKGAPILEETRTMTFYDDPVNRTIDFDLTLKALETAKFGDTKEGTFAIRLADAMSEKRGGKMTNAEGATGMKNVWGKASKWVDYSGEINTEKLGVAIFDYPANPRHPTTWHSRDYGLFAANIFGLHDFTGDKTKDGSLTLKPGEELHFRYRVFIHPGATDPAAIEKEYKKYAGEK